MLVDIKHNLVIVPAAAIQRGPQGTYVYTVSPDDTVHIKVVTIAQTTGNNVGISAGINGGDIVVIDGQAPNFRMGAKSLPALLHRHNQRICRAARRTKIVPAGQTCGKPIRYIESR